jgi:hypothetical protein
MRSVLVVAVVVGAASSVSFMLHFGATVSEVKVRMFGSAPR